MTSSPKSSTSTSIGAAFRLLLAPQGRLEALAVARARSPGRRTRSPRRSSGSPAGTRPRPAPSRRPWKRGAVSSEVLDPAPQGSPQVREAGRPGCSRGSRRPGSPPGCPRQPRARRAAWVLRPRHGKGDSEPLEHAAYPPPSTERSLTPSGSIVGAKNHAGPPRRQRAPPGWAARRGPGRRSRPARRRARSPPPCRRRALWRLRHAFSVAPNRCAQEDREPEFP